MAGDANCHLCHERETFLHLYWECEHTKQIWHFIFQRLMLYLSEFGMGNTEMAACMLPITKCYHLLLISTYTICIIAVFSQVPNTVTLWNRILNIRKYEYRVNNYQGSLEKFHAKWASFEAPFDIDYL